MACAWVQAFKGSGAKTKQGLGAEPDQGFCPWTLPRDGRWTLLLDPGQWVRQTSGATPTS